MLLLIIDISIIAIDIDIIDIASCQLRQLILYYLFSLSIIDAIDIDAAITLRCR
jgi:hypothetical protein